MPLDDATGSSKWCGGWHCAPVGPVDRCVCPQTGQWSSWPCDCTYMHTDPCGQCRGRQSALYLGAVEWSSTPLASHGEWTPHHRVHRLIVMFIFCQNIQFVCFTLSQLLTSIFHCTITGVWGCPKLPTFSKVYKPYTRGKGRRFPYV